MSPMDVRGQKVSCTSESLLAAPHPGEDVGRMIAGYQPGRRGMAGSAAYSLTQRTARMSARRATVYQVTRWLARQGTLRAVDYNTRTVVLNELGRCRSNVGRQLTNVGRQLTAPSLD
ncbi:hypothetical protein Acr_00g0083920 [Actinidia rufa]|uniref:Uncharacterized protein n=1 Tax=Actinidia rufa TaxID=165716 RepID=A0A7J0DXK9_9ERIC|nr:hypothetical protein Acr_00g0083920 [Actinidia rufa]